MRLLALLSLLPLLLPAQQLRTNEAGEKIIVYNDGTARYFNDGTLIEAQRRDSAAAAYPVVSVQIEPLAGGVDPSEADLRRIAERKLQLAVEAEELARQRAAAAVNNRLTLEKQLADARQRPGTDAASLQRRLRLARQLETSTLAERTAAEQRRATAEQVVSTRQYVEAYNQARRAERRGPVAPDVSRSERDLAMLFPAPPTFSGYGSPSSTLTRAEPPLCGTAPTPTITPGTPVSYPITLFNHTDETLRPYLDGKEYLTCSAWVARDDATNQRYLTLRLTFSNPNAMVSYGYLPENSSLSLHLLNGKVFSVQAARKTVGILNHGRGEVNYEVAYRLPKSLISELENTPLDFVRVFWSSGFEQYEVYRVTALNRIMGCL